MEGANFKYQLNLPESGWPRLLLEISLDTNCHHNGLGMKSGRNKFIKLGMKREETIPFSLE